MFKCRPLSVANTCGLGLDLCSRGVHPPPETFPPLQYQKSMTNNTLVAITSRRSVRLSLGELVSVLTSATFFIPVGARSLLLLQYLVCVPVHV